MTVALAPTPVVGLRDAVSDLLSTDYTALCGDDLLGVLREIDTQRHRLTAVDHTLLAELDARRLAHEHGARDTADLLHHLLRLTPGEARARVRAAADLGPRRELTGTPLPPLFPAVAAAQTDGTISTRHAAVITTLIDRLPDTVQATHAADVEATMLDHALRFDPNQLAALARRHEAHLNPDGILGSDAEHTRRRDTRLRANRDGSGELNAHLTPAALAVWQAVLDPLAAPPPPPTANTMTAHQANAATTDCSTPANDCSAATYPTAAAHPSPSSSP